MTPDTVAPCISRAGHRDETERRASAATLLGAIDSGDPLSVAEFLSALTPFERQTALTEVCRTASSPPGAMLPIFHAAYSGNVDVFVAVHLALMDNLPRDTVSRFVHAVATAQLSDSVVAL